MVVICPKCKVKLKVADEKVAPEGTRFKCPKCGTVLLVKRPVAQARLLDSEKVLVGHEDPAIRERIRSILTRGGFKVILSADGIEAMVNATRELPFLAILSVSLPKIYGFEVGSRLKTRPGTKGMKILLVASLYDKYRYRREPATLHGADGYVEEHQLEESLLGEIYSLREKVLEKTMKAPVREEKAGPSSAISTPAVTPAPQAGIPETEAKKEEAPLRPIPKETKPEQSNAPVEKARRLARTIVSDIYLYNRAKVDEAIKKGSFHAAFASDLKEGLKLYENRIPVEVKKLGDFFNEAVNNFIEKRKESFKQP